MCTPFRTWQLSQRKRVYFSILLDIQTGINLWGKLLAKLWLTIAGKVNLFKCRIYVLYVYTCTCYIVGTVYIVEDNKYILAIATLMEPYDPDCF